MQVIKLEDGNYEYFVLLYRKRYARVCHTIAALKYELKQKRVRKDQISFPRTGSVSEKQREEILNDL